MINRTITNAQNLQGVFPALFTPLCSDSSKFLNNQIDYEKAKSMIDSLIEKGINGLVPMGTTGQSATVSTQQHLDFIRFTIDYVDDRVPIIAGAGSNSTRESIEMINLLQKEVGNLTCLCVTGYYNNPPIEGIIRHFESIVNESGVNIILYNVPSRTQSYITPEAIIELAKIPEIIGLKQAVNFRTDKNYQNDTNKIIENTQKFSLLSGEDDSLYTMLHLGGKGIITATGNIPEAAALFLSIIDFFSKNNLDEAQKTQELVNTFVKMCFIAKNPIPLASFFNSPVYLPLINLEEMEGGEAMHQQILDFIKTGAPSLSQYH